MSISSRLGVLLLFLGLLAAALRVSLAVGSNPIPLERVWQLLIAPDGSYDASVITEQRLPRTLLVALVGAALGVAGALMQSLTRNPLADPGILGVNAGAALAVVVAVAVFGLTSIWFTLWFAFAGAARARGCGDQHGGDVAGADCDFGGSAGLQRISLLGCGLC